MSSNGFILFQPINFWNTREEPFGIQIFGNRTQRPKKHQLGFKDPPRNPRKKPKTYGERIYKKREEEEEEAKNTRFVSLSAASSRLESFGTCCCCRFFFFFYHHMSCFFFFSPFFVLSPDFYLEFFTESREISEWFAR